MRQLTPRSFVLLPFLSFLAMAGCSDQPAHTTDSGATDVATADAAMSDGGGADDSVSDGGAADGGATDGSSDTGGICANPYGGPGQCARDTDCQPDAICMPNREVCWPTELCLDPVDQPDERTPETCGLDLDVGGSCYELDTCGEPDAEILEVGDVCADDGTCPKGFGCFDCACVKVRRK